VRAHCPPRRWPRSASVTSPAEVATGGGGRAGGTAPAAGSRVACRLPSGPGGATRPGGANRTKRRGASRRLLSLPRAGGQPGGEHIGTWYAVEACSGPFWGRETADNNGQPRCPTDNQTCSSSAVMRRDGAAGPSMACKGSEPGSAERVRQTRWADGTRTRNRTRASVRVPAWLCCRLRCLCAVGPGRRTNDHRSPVGSGFRPSRR
jgi:hypothetical protein